MRDSALIRNSAYSAAQLSARKEEAPSQNEVLAVKEKKDKKRKEKKEKGEKTAASAPMMASVLGTTLPVSSSVACFSINACRLP